MFATLPEIERSLLAALRLARRDEGAVDGFNLSVEGFWHSFSAALLLVPVALLFFFAEHRLTLELQPEMLLPAMPLYATVELAGYALDWASFPVLMIFIARQLGLTHRYVPYIIAHNWASVIAALILLPPIAIYLSGLVGAEAALAGNFVTLVLVVLYQKRVAEVVLGLPSWPAFSIAIIDVFVGIFYEVLTGLAHAALGPGG